MEMKGFYFSLDAVMGLMVIGLGTGLIAATTQISQGVTGEDVKFDQYSSQALDISYLMVEEDFSSLNNSYRDDLIQGTSLERTETTSIAEAILALHNEGDPEASELAENYFQTYKYPTGLYIEGNQLVDINASERSSMRFQVPSKNESKRFTVVVGRE